ncbi:MAG: helix-turn-helix transcriptional regulator [Ferruginibacter sp.]
MEKIKMYGTKIRSLRLLRGYSQEHMATELDITQTTYSRIETDKQKLTAPMLERLAQVLGVSVPDITSNEPLIIQNNASNYGAQGRIENFYADQKDLYQKMIDAKDKEIERLLKQMDSLMKLLEKKK